MTIARSLKLIDDLLSDVITGTDQVPNLRKTVRQLHEYTGGFPASTSDAPPSTSRMTPSPDDDVKLTKVEADAFTPDQARQALERIDVLLARLTLSIAYLSPAQIRMPATNLEARLAFIRRHLNQLLRDPPGKPQRQQVGHIRGMVRELAGICVRYQPPLVPDRFQQACRSHERANVHAAIDAHYTRQHLCRWCGDFHAVHKVIPTVELIRLHDRGIKITATILRNNKIRVA